MLTSYKPRGPKIILRSLFLLAGLPIAACSPTGSVILSHPIVVEPVIVEEVAMETAEPKRSRVSRTTAKAGVLTAGDIDDTLNIQSFLKYQKAAKRETKLPMSNLSRPVLASLRDSSSTPAPNVRFTLRKPNSPEPFFEGYSGVDGNITVFPAVLGAGRLSEVELRAFPEGQGAVDITRLKSTGARTSITLPFQSVATPDFLDLAFVVDTTGSMTDELRWLTEDLKTIVRIARKSAPGVDIRYGLIVYRDKGDAYVVKNYGFTKSERQMRNWLRQQTASGGGDYPEAAATALRQGVALDWRRGKGERLMFHIADAPPHDRDARAYLEAARQAAAANVQIFGLGASGVAAESEFLMRQAAVQTSGRYLFLTDDSGVGNRHAEPTISCYRATDLTGLMTRVLRSELSGRRIEAPESQVLRRVGSYDRGVCRN